jgi:CRP-like cAMP-binding protein
MGTHPSWDEAQLGPDAESLGRSCRYPRGAELFAQGEILREVVYVVSGVIKLTQSDALGRESIAGLAFAREWLGTAAVIAGQPTPVTAFTCSDTVLTRVPADTFRALLLRDPRVSLQIHQAHSRELCRQTTWIGQMCSLGSLKRLQCVLCRFVATQSLLTCGSTIKLQLPIRHWELAEFIGVSPEHVSRLLGDMEANGLIRREKSWIVIPDPKRLCNV